jgi:2-alkyl-3-oxoalkanoate reductase
MKILVTGATGAIGTRLIPLLTEAGHTVVGTTTTEAKTARLREAGAEPLVLDVLDAEAVREAVESARPEVIVHEATALAGNLTSLRNLDKAFAGTNRLRTEGTDHLLDAAAKSGVRRFIAQSYAGWPFAREGGAIKPEEARLDPTPVRGSEQTLAAIRHLEEAVTTASGMDGLVLRYGGFYGPGTSLAPGGEQAEMVAKRRFPVAGSGEGIWSMIHIEDAARATAAAVEHGTSGLYHITDDEPAAVKEWLPGLALIMGAPAPRHVPLWLAKLAAGPFVAMASTEIRGASNAKAKRELEWKPQYGSWRDGFRSVFTH